MATARPRFAQVELPPQVVRLIGRYFFGTGCITALLAALLFVVLPPDLAVLERTLLVGGFTCYAVLSALTYQASLRAAFRMDRGLFALAVAAMLLVAGASVALQVGPRNPGLGLGALVAFMLCAITRRRNGLAFALFSAIEVALLALAEQRGWIPSRTPAPAPLLLVLIHWLVIGCGVAGGALIARVLDHYLQAAAEREVRFRGLLAVAADHYWEMDAQFRFTRFSDSHNQPIDEAHTARLGLTPWDMPDPGLSEAQLDAHRADLEAHRPFKGLITRHLGASGRSRYSSISGEPRFGPQGEFLGYWGVGRNVTSEIRAQQAVAASEHRYRELFARSPSPLLLHRRGIVIDANGAAARLFGYPDSAAMRGTSILKRFPAGEARERVMQRLAQLDQLAIGQGLPVADHQLTSIDGQVLSVQTTAVRVDTVSGPAVLTLLFDVTERKATEAALRRSEAMLSHVFATSPDCLTLTELETGRYTLVNEGFLRVAGYTRDEVIGRTSTDLGIWNDPADRTTFTDALRRHGSLQDMPFVFRRRDGGRVSMLVSAASFDFEGRCFVVINARDVSVREQGRLEVEAILNTVSLAIAFVRGRHIVRTNPRHRQMFGWSAEELEHETMAALWADPQDFQAVRADAGARLRAGQPFDTECQLRRRDGSLFWCRLQAQAVDPRDPIGGGTIWTAEDITERREFERTLAAARDAAEAANRAKSAFLANMSHEIRTPLNGLLGLARLALQHELPDARRQQYLHQILDSTQGLAGIISDILDLSKVEAGKLALETMSFGLRELLRSVHHAYVSLAEGKGLTLSLAIDDAVPAHVSGDPVRVRQILSNFVTNALKFTERGSVRIEAVALAGDRVRLEVHDTGPGIPEATQQRLFMPFSQADDSTTRRYGGTGLGLSICRQLAQLMGGEVGVHSTPGAGSRFWAELPLPPARPADDDADGEAADALRLHGARVLMAEDNPVNMLIAVAMLEQWGVEVTQATDGAMAVDAVHAAVHAGRPFDAVLMDVHMPVMSGHAAVRVLREEYDAGTLPVIALTAAALVSEREAALAAGMNDFLTKPIDAGRLRQALVRVVARPATA